MLPSGLVDHNFKPRVLRFPALSYTCGTCGGLLIHWHVDLDQVAFATGWYRSQRYPCADFIGLKENSPWVFIERGCRQKELDGAALVGKSSREHECLIEHLFDDVVGAISRRIIPDEFTKLTIVLLAGKIVIAGRDCIADVDADHSVWEFGTYSERNGLDGCHIVAFPVGWFQGFWDE
jgi:hypothetical protein